MNMMDGIAATASSLASAQLQQSYTLAVSKKAMESDPRCCPEPVCTAGMTHIRAPFYVIWFRVLRLIPFV